ncbi:MAG: hemolysin family protein [Anaerolineae bacterium]
MLLVIVDMVITLGYASLQNSRQSELQNLADEGRAFAKTALTLLEAKSRLYITYILASMFILTGIVFITMTWLNVMDVSNSGITLTPPLTGFIVFAVSFVALIIGTVVPEAIGSAYAIPIITVLAAPLRLVTLLLSPLSSILLGVSVILAKIFGSDKMVNTVTEEEIMTLVNAGNTGGTIEDEEREMIFSILQLDETYARELMVPRIDMEAIEGAMSLSDALDLFMRTGLSRLPVYDDNVDNIVGLLYAKDLLNLWHNGGLEGHTTRELVRSAYFVPETLTADVLLRDMQARNIHMAIVVDEYGGTSGLVTIENIMEEIVGDIRDEYDFNEENEYIQHNEDEFIIDGGMDIDDVNELLGTNISSDDSDTLGGYIFLQIGRVPIVEEIIETDVLHMVIRAIEGRRIRKVLVKVKPKLEEDTSSENTNDQMTEVVDPG